MEKLCRLFIANYKERAGVWNEEVNPVSGFTIKLNYDENKKRDFIIVESVFGSAPTTQEVFEAVGMFIDEYTRVYSKILVQNRTKRIRFGFESTPTGAEDNFIEVDNGNGYVSRKLLYHSDNDVINEGVESSFYDFADMLVLLGKIKGDCYYEGLYNQMEFSLEMIKLRDIAKEYDWIEPDDDLRDGFFVDLNREGVIKEI